MPFHVVPQTNSSTSKLQEYCEKFQLSDPDFAVRSTQSGGGFYCTVTIAGESYTGAIRFDEEEAKESAAIEFAVQLLCLSQTHPTMDELDEHVIPLVATKWYELGLALLNPGSKDSLDYIKKQYKEDVQLNCRKMFSTWLQESNIATWYQLIEATRCMFLNDVADNIESLLLQGVVGTESEATSSETSIHSQPWNQLLMQLSLSSISKVGVAIIVSNDYAGTEHSKLNGTHKDAERMLMALSKLGYAVCHCKTMYYYELTDTVDRIAALLPFISCKNVVIVFSGYAIPGEQHDDGDDDGDDKKDISGQLYTQDGWTISVSEILDYFSAYKHPKLFFCQNAIPKSQCSGYHNFLKFNQDHFTKYENFLVACSTLPYRKSRSGSLWIELLSEAIQHLDNDVTFLLNDINSRIKGLYNSFGLFVAPEPVNKLTEPVNYLAESLTASSSSATSRRHHVMQPLWPEVTLDVPIIPQVSITQSYVAKLQEHCQKLNLSDPNFVVLPTQRGGGFYCTVTIAGESYTGAIRLDEEEAKESAAEEVVQMFNIRS